MTMKELMRMGRREFPAFGEERTPFLALQEEMNRLFEEFWRGMPALGFEHPWTEGAYVPRVDVEETDRELRVTAELPGMTEKDVEVTLAKGVLTITGEKKDTHEETERGYHHFERTYGKFRRVIPLPREVDRKKISATCREGVLTVTMPKIALPKGEEHKIEVKAA